MSTKDSADSEDELLGDLESLRSILDEEDELMPQDDEAVPLLDDVVADAADAEEPARASPGGLDDDLFQALLSDDWRESAAAIIEQAPAALGQAVAWKPREIAALRQALRLKQDETLNQWISDALERHAEALQAELLEAFSGELKPAVEGILRRDAGGEHGE
ncbi:MAG TPA: hypothetical protein VIS55_11665 [Pseudomonadales bacterium]|jgi:hypothetical protein